MRAVREGPAAGRGPGSALAAQATGLLPFAGKASRNLSVAVTASFLPFPPA